MKIVKLHNTRSYLLAGKLLHIISLIEMVVILLIIPVLYKMETNTVFLFVLKIYAIVFLLSLPVFSQLDARSRYQNYKQIKDQIYIYGFDTRILKPVVRSRCQRDAAILSASELGFKKECKQYFRSMGYKWYQVYLIFYFQNHNFYLLNTFGKQLFSLRHIISKSTTR